MLTIKEMLVMKKEYGFSYEYIAEKSGVPLSTVQKVFSKTTGAPRRKTIEALNKAFDEQDIVRFKKINDNAGYSADDNSDGYEYCSVDCENSDSKGCNTVCEEEAQYGISDNKSGIANDSYGTNGIFDGTAALKLEENRDKTIEDYLRLPEGTRVELIDGVFYDMAAPTTIHQKIGAYINIELEKHIDSNNGRCVAFIAPTDVQLDCDDKTMVQPDVLVVCDRDKITRARIVGAPDFVVEVLSESNWYHDVIRKERKYRNADVREYWIVIPEKRIVLVYEFEKSTLPTEYTFQDKIPIGIWDGKCVIDFAVLSEKIAILWEK